MSVGQTVQKVLLLRQQYPEIRHVVITGGEPLLQAALPDLCDALKAHELHLTIETNGTLIADLQADLISISPKLDSSVPADPKLAAMHQRLRMNPGVISKWLKKHECQLKFVVTQASDEDDIDHLLNELPEEKLRGNICLMPQGITADQLAAHASICVEICVRRGWHYTPRAHIEIFGNARGT